MLHSLETFLDWLFGLVVMVSVLAIIFNLDYVTLRVGKFVITTLTRWVEYRTAKTIR